MKRKSFSARERIAALPNIQSVSKRFWKFVDVRDKKDCWLWTGGMTAKGYGRFRLGAVAKGMIGPHVFSYHIANMNGKDGKIICHACDNPSCVNPDHLFAGSSSDNLKDCIKKGRGKGQFIHGFDPRRKRGIDSQRSKLTNDAVLKIRSDTRTHREIANEYGVDRSLIGLVKRKKVWAHV